MLEPAVGQIPAAVESVVEPAVLDLAVEQVPAAAVESVVEPAALELAVEQVPVAAVESAAAAVPVEQESVVELVLVHSVVETLVAAADFGPAVVE